MASPRKIGTEMLAATATAGGQYDPAITRLTDGRFVVGWTSDGPLPTFDDPRGQVFDANGNRVGAEITFNTSATGSQMALGLASMSGGRLLATWLDAEDSGKLKHQVIAADGSKAGPEVTFAAPPGGAQDGAVVATLTGGGMVAVWSDWRRDAGDAEGTSITLRMLTGEGVPTGAETRVNVATAGWQDSASVAALTDGRFVVTWVDSNLGVRARLFNPTGAAVGGEIAISPDTASFADPVVTGLVGGGFAVAWYSPQGVGADTTNGAVGLRVYGANGAPSTAAIAVGVAVQGGQMGASITRLGDGRIVVVWEDSGETETPGVASLAVRGRMFLANGEAVGDEFTANSIVVGNQSEPVVTALEGNRFAVAWSDDSASPDDPDWGAIRTQVFDGGIAGTSGNDTLSDTTGANLIFGASGNDIVDGLAGDDLIDGGAGDDTLLGRAGLDRLEGKLGNDVLSGGAGADTLDGGGGIDTADYSDAGLGLVVDLGATARNTGDAAGDVLISIERVIGSAHADELVGAGLADTLEGGAGDDALFGRAGDDVLRGGAGNDTLRGEGGTDSLHGLDGDDVIHFDPADAAIDGGAGFDTARATTNDGLRIRMDAWNVEQLFAGGGNDEIFTFGTAAYRVDAGAGNDRVSGNAFGDVLGGNLGNDVLSGLQGNDTLGGGAGSDRLTGGVGADTLFGEADPDSYIYAGMADAGDLIIGFETSARFGANGDRLELQRSGFDASLALGTLATNRFVAGQATQTFGQFLFDTNTGRLFWDADGRGIGAPQLLLTVQGVSDLRATDFVLV